MDISGEITRQLNTPDKTYILLNFDSRQLPFDAIVIARASTPIKNRVIIAHVDLHPLITTWFGDPSKMYDEFLIRTHDEKIIITSDKKT